VLRAAYGESQLFITSKSSFTEYLNRYNQIPVRVRILKPSEGILDGVSLGHLIPGLTYEVDRAVGRHLVQMKHAEEISTATPGLVVPLDNPHAFEQLTKGVTVNFEPSHQADDRDRRDGTPDRRRISRGDRRRSRKF
jgi:hypothetical protein